MNYYERIQQAINYMEENLEQVINVKEVAREAYMSESSCHRMFLAIVGYSIKQYIRLRRMDEASKDLLFSDLRVIDIAVKYSYESSDSFTRIFKKVAGIPPSSFRKGKQIFHFERINIMDQYFEMQETNEIEEYPDIKVLKKLRPIQVAYYCYYGEEPEEHAFRVINKWIRNNKIDCKKSGCRIFGYNNPSPNSPEQKEYGYEVCITIDDIICIEDELVQIKTLMGGSYAVISIKREENLGLEISKGWKRFEKWLKASKYVFGEHQWMEEHLGFSEEGEHIGGVDLYMPIVQKI